MPIRPVPKNRVPIKGTLKADPIEIGAEDPMPPPPDKTGTWEDWEKGYNALEEWKLRQSPELIRKIQAEEKHKTQVTKAKKRRRVGSKAHGGMAKKSKGHTDYRKGGLVYKTGSFR